MSSSLTLYDIVFLLGDNLGYTEILIITFLISLLIFVPIPYIPVLIIALFNNRLDPNLIALCSAIGVTFGRCVIFLASYQGRNLLNKATLERMAPLQKLLARYGSLVSFIAAITPIPPDDIVIILLGIAKFKIWKFALTAFVGKLIINLAMVWAVILWGLPFTQQLLNQSTDPILLVIAVMVGLISTGIVLYLTTRLDWGMIVGKRFPWTLYYNKDKE